MYHLLWDGDDGTHLGNVFAQYVRDGGSAWSCRFRFRRRLCSLFPVGTRLRLSTSLAGAGSDGGAGSPICF